MTDYVGRHRPPTRAERRAVEGRKRLPKALSAGYALPTAAAATLVITAGGATAAQTSAFAAGGSQAALVAPERAQAKATTALADPSLAEAVRSDVATTVASYSDLAQRRKASNDTIAADQGRTQESQRVARDKRRKALAARIKASKASKASSVNSTTAVGTDGKAAKAAVSESGWVLPLAAPVFTSGFGSRWGRLHAGNDFGCPIGTPLMAMSTGTVVFAGEMQGYGTAVDIKYADGTVSRFGHMSSISTSVGAKVTPGQVVGLSGNTGRSTGPHLHLEIHPAGGAPVDPRPWLASKGLTY